MIGRPRRSTGAPSTAWPAAPATAEQRDGPGVRRRPRRRRLASVGRPDLGAAPARSATTGSTSRSPAGRTGTSRASSSTAPTGSTPSTSSSVTTASASTSPPRTAFDLAAGSTTTPSPRSSSSSSTRSAARSPTLFATGRRLGERGRNGSARFARVLQSRPALLKPAGQRPRAPARAGARSTPGSRGRSASTRSGCRRARSSTPTSTGRPSEEALEVDHVTWHGGKLDLTYDKRRDRQLWQLGVHVTRVTDDEIRHHLGRVVADIAAILRSRAA